MINYPNGRKYVPNEKLQEALEKINQKETKNKYNAIKQELDNLTFASQKEAQRYAELKIMEQAGEIEGMQTQVPFTLIPKSAYGREIRYVADFVYVRNGEKIIEDTKSTATKTPVYRLKKRLLAEKYGIIIQEV